MVAVLDGDLVAEELRRAGTRVRDQGLGLRQFQFEVVTQELGEALFDLLGFGLGSDEPQQVIVSVSDISQPPVSRILRILTGQAALLLA